MLKIANEKNEVVGQIIFGNGEGKTGRPYYYVDTVLKLGDSVYNIRHFLDHKDVLILKDYINNK